MVYKKKLIILERKIFGSIEKNMETNEQNRNEDLNSQCIIDWIQRQSRIGRGRRKNVNKITSCVLVNRKRRLRRRTVLYIMRPSFVRRVKRAYRREVAKGRDGLHDGKNVVLAAANYYY